MGDKKKWVIEWAVEAKAYLTSVKKYHQKIVLKKIDEELTFAPWDVHSKKKWLEKVPRTLAKYGVPIWQLTIYPYRIRYGLEGTALKILVMEMIYKPKQGKKEEGEEES